MSKSLWDCHLEVIALLRDRGETILLPMHIKPHGGTPQIYLKNENYPSENFKIGTGLKQKDGSFEILGEHLIWYISGLSIEELGLCDSAIEIENYDLLHPIVKYKDCPYCQGKGRIPE